MAHAAARPTPQDHLSTDATRLGRVEAFGDDAFELVGARDLERAVKRRGDSPARPGGRQRPREQLAVVVVGTGTAIEMQYVEADERRAIPRGEA